MCLKGADQGECQQGRQRHIRAGGTRVNKEQGAGGENQQPEQRSPPALHTIEQVAAAEGSEQAQQRNWKSCRLLRDTEETKAQGPHPEQERGLLQPGPGIEGRGNKVSGPEHLFADTSVSRFIRPEESHVAQIQEVNDVQGKDD